MKRLNIVVFGALLSWNTGFSQLSNSIADLQNGGSSLCTATNIKTGESMEGNCFLIKVSDRYYVITNYHIVDSLDYFTKQRVKGPCDLLEIVILKGIKTKTFSIKTSKEFNKWAQTTYYKKDSISDLVAYEVGNGADLSTAVIVNPDNDYQLKKGDEVFTVSAVHDDPFIYTYSIWAKVISDPSKDIVRFNRDLPIFATDRPIYPGMSGSPVFTWPDKSKPPVFAGVVFASSDKGEGLIWKKEDVLNLIKEIQRHH